ncbi:MAG: DNA-3-methyladenine glycosylase I [Clostridiales bacterium]|nr:DNA-3-methyladenine glycosylase I [Clostridiales bacterium]
MSGPLERDYHDQVWGVPEHDERALFRMLILEGQQAGLSWSTILKKMDALRAAYDDFDPEKLACYGEDKVEALLQNPGIIRNRLKVRAAIGNARCYLKLCQRHGSLGAFIWGYVGGRPIVNEWQSADQVPAATDLSGRISKDLKALGFSFVGSTIVYAYLQAIGVVNDHLAHCAFRRAPGR